MGLGLSLGLRLAGQASPRPSFLAGNEYWGFTASPTPQFAHFGRSTNKAGALTSGRNGIVRDVDSSGIYNAIPANEASVLAGRGFAGFAALAALNANGNNPQSASWVNAGGASSSAGTPFGIFTPSIVTTAGTADARRRTNLFALSAGQVVAVKYRYDAQECSSPSTRSRLVALNHTASLTSILDGDIGALAPATSSAGVFSVISQSANVCFVLFTAGSAGNYSFGGGPGTTDVGRQIRVCGIDVTSTAYVPSRWVSTTSPAPTTVADNTTIPDWQAFVERYSLLDGLTIDATANIRLTPSAARRILTIGTANDGFFLEQTTSNTIRAVLRASSADVWTMTSGAIGAAGNRRVQVTLKPGANALTVEGVTGASNSNATALPDAIRTNPAYVGRDIAGSLHWNGNIPSLKIGKAG